MKLGNGGKRQMIGLELMSVSKLFAAWSYPDIVDRRADQWDQKIEAIREALLKGLRPKGQRGRIKQGIAGEIVEDEYLTIESMIQWHDQNLSNSLKSRSYQFTIDWPNKTHDTFSRPWPISNGAARRELQNRTADGARRTMGRVQLIHSMVSERLGVTPEAVEKLVASPRAFGKNTRNRSLLQRILASLILDVDDRPEEWAHLAVLLDALGATGYHPLMTVYLIQAKQTISASDKGIHLPGVDGGLVTAMTSKVFDKYPQPSCVQFRDIVRDPLRT